MTLEPCPVPYRLLLEVFTIVTDSSAHKGGPGTQVVVGDGKSACEEDILLTALELDGMVKDESWSSSCEGRVLIIFK